MFRMKLGLASAFRSLGAIMLIGGLGVILTMPATADDHEPVGGGPVPTNCHNCKQSYGCMSALGCFCFEGGYCRPFEGLPECLCQP